jgi:hypothetical protein
LLLQFISQIASPGLMLSQNFQAAAFATFFWPSVPGSQDYTMNLPLGVVASESRGLNLFYSINH